MQNDALSFIANISFVDVPLIDVSLVDISLFAAILIILLSWGHYLRNRLDFKRFPTHHGKEDASSIGQLSQSSISQLTFCIPARNEAHNLERHLPLFCQTGCDIVVVDDESTDHTRDVLATLQNQYLNLKVLQSAPRPKGWLGKTWACQQAADQATSPWICFVDADVWCSESFLNRFVPYFEQSSAQHDGLITIWPQQVLGTFWEVVVIPHVYVALLTFLPIRYQARKPRWMPSALYKRMAYQFAAANGQWMTFHKDTYQAIGGHETVKHHIVEDVELAKRVVRQGYSLQMYKGVDDVFCRMYQSPQQMWEGFMKNFFAGFGYNTPLFVFMGLLHIVVYLIPPITLLSGMTIPVALHTWGMAALATFLAIGYRGTVNWSQKWPPLSSPLHFLGVLWFEALAIQILWNQMRGKPTVWKGRKIEL
ncbi:MAG: glycosyltransferase family 2 protein [Balneolaceae bacterium]|nr:glycosyltransferase family 2 protein [Balneolaceae bacterium]